MMIRAAARRSSGFRSSECRSSGFRFSGFRSSACDSTRYGIVFVAVVGVFACCLLPQARGADVNLDDAATAETNDEVARYTDRIRAYVNITFIDPLTGLRRSEKSLKGKWGTNGRMEQVVAPAHIAKYAGNVTDGCQPLDQPIPTGPWIAIIERGQCRFSEKIQNAIDANATAVIIYDNEPNKTPLFMHHDVENAVAIFITKEFGDRIVSLIDNETKVLVRITIGLEPSQYPRINRTSVLFVSISFIILMIISLAWLIFYYIQRFRYAHAKDRLAKRLSQAAKKAITKIPLRTLKASDKEVDHETEACAICIDSFLVGEVVRVLPCQHTFHKSCVDPWLLEQRTCPMCKLDILKAFGLQICPSQDSLSRMSGRTSRPMHVLAESEEGLGFDSSHDEVNGFSSEPSSAFRSSPRIVHIATSISAAGRLANVPAPPRNNNLTSRLEGFSRPRNMVCPRHGVSVGSCSHDVDMTPPEETTTPVKDDDDDLEAAAAGVDRVEEFAEVTLDGDNDEDDDDDSSSPTRCKCSDDDDDDDDDDDGNDDRRHHHHHPATKENAQKGAPSSSSSSEMRNKKSELLTKEVFLTPPLPGAPVVDVDENDEGSSSSSTSSSSPPTPPPAHPLTPETLIASRTTTRRMSSLNHRGDDDDDDEDDMSSPSPSPPAPRAAAAPVAAAAATPDRLFDHRSAPAVDDCRPSSALSDLSACNETTRLNGSTGI